MLDCETFTLEGVTYSQQYRKCGKAGCKTCQNASANGNGWGQPSGHGPYWYSRDPMTGYRRYLGRELPPNVVAARQELRRQRDELGRQLGGLRQQAAALDRLLKREHLSGRDRELVEWLGFRDCLVQSPATAPTQDPAPTAGLCHVT